MVRIGSSRTGNFVMCSGLPRVGREALICRHKTANCYREPEISALCRFSAKFGRQNDCRTAVDGGTGYGAVTCPSNKSAANWGDNRILIIIIEGSSLPIASVLHKQKHAGCERSLRPYGIMFELRSTSAFIQKNRPHSWRQ
jgi:hypothetical protein